MYSFFKKKLFVFFFFFGSNILFSIFAWGNLTASTAIVGQSIASQSVDDIIQQQQSVVEILKQNLEDLQKKFEGKIEDKYILADLRLQAQEISKRAINVAFVLRAPLNDINVLLGQSIDSDDGQKNLKDQGQESSTLTEQKAKLNSTVRQLEEIFLAANKMAESASSYSRDLFTRTLTHRFEFSIAMIKDIIETTKEAAFDFFVLFNYWWQFVSYFKLLQLFFAFFIPFVIALSLSYFVGKGIAHVRFRIVKGGGEIPYLQRLLVAFISILLPSCVCVLCVYLTFFLFISFGLDLGKLTGVFHTIGHQIIFIFLVNRIAVVLLSSRMDRLRLFNIAPLSAYQLIICLTLLAVVLAFDAVSDSIYQVVSASFSLAIAKSFIAVFLVGALLFIISFLPFRFKRKCFQSDEEKLLPWPFYIRFPLIILGALLIVTDFLGYIGLARFIMQQIVISGAFLALMYLGIQSSRAIASEGAFMKTSVGRTLMKWFHLEEKTMDQLGIVSNMLLNLVVIVLCAMPIVMQFGFSHSDMMDVFWQLMTGFQIGNVSISLISIFAGILVFFVCWFLIRLFVGWLDRTVMVRGGFDSGVRNSIKTVISYGGIAASALMGLSMSGLDLKGFALIAGGLSLGIGFGLQNIVQNFVSGLIILIGRPFKLGDYVESGSVSGIVKRISVRATELETFQRQRIIIPNSSLINNNVSNWTRPSKMGRVDIPLTVSTNINPERVVEILLEIASVTENVLKNPSPQVSFTAFDSKHFSFTLAIYVPNIVFTSEVTNALHFVLYKRFIEEGILE
ncbi:mechanosensitive ion channel family protein [Bartonella sp. A05]|uniref:mechanosensitive ion channel family protein n=1 Tax=Bartonella sp. A05 TaxID=2967261 RepID=UPI0022A996AB|nr:mechanosensitive ion channel domain-containing protein [Bartonella sp. A05]MCZ2204026.1 mechanosensitive ion channel [Bartonella sp. A05]